MAKGQGQKMKIIYLMKILLEETNEKHPMTSAKLIQRLAAYGITAERKSIYSDIEDLLLYGIDIVNKKDAPTGYYVASHDFELPELKLLVDAVQSAKFITAKKSNELIKRLEGLANHYDAKQLQRQVFVNNRVKTMNESIYYNVDAIHAAVNAGKQISFGYWEWTVKKEMKLRREGAPYIESPWMLSWNDENYYLIAYDNQDEKIKHFRVDKMKDIEILEEKREGQEIFQSLKLPDYDKKVFDMFGGEDVTVHIKCANYLVGVVIDRFGKDIPIIPVDEDHFKAIINVSVSTHFYGWLVSLGEGVELLAPENIHNDFVKYMWKIISHYR